MMMRARWTRWTGAGLGVTMCGLMIASIASIASIAPIASIAAQGSAPNQANYDESKVPQYTLPDPLTLSSGERVTDIKTWSERRRPELLHLFETQVYGRPAHATKPKS